jgi:hypothetical protein
MATACGQPAPGASCEQAAVQAIDTARAAEGVGPLVLPAGYNALKPAGQLLVIADLERVDRGLPGFSGLSAQLDAMAQRGAAQGQDPTGPVNFAWGSNLALGYTSVLAADYAWMYDDGPGSDNVDCTATSRSGCWGHRQNILGDYGPDPAMGAAAVTAILGGAPVLSMTQLFATSPAGPLAYRIPALQR